jgi:hypothetical protein
VQKIATKKTKDGKKITLYKVSKRRWHYKIGEDGEVIEDPIRAWEEWDKVFDYRKTK